MILAQGTRVLHKDSRMGTVVSFLGKHNGYRIRFDEPRQFEPENVRVYANALTPVDPALHEQWEAKWPAFERKHRAWAQW